MNTRTATYRSEDHSGLLDRLRGAVPRRLDPQWMLDRVRYQTRHRTMAVALGAYMALLHRRTQPEVRPDPRALRHVHHSLMKMLARDLANVEAGHYPRELLHAFPLASYLRAVPELLRDQKNIFERVRTQRHDELPAEAEPERYPPYYRRTFHWQSDGWLSLRSARLYDLSVELLFGGAADVMRRMTLPPLLSEIRHLPHPRVLDIACGTGRFLDALRRSLPNAHLYGIDLSPFYIAHARAQLSGAPHVALSAQNAESLSFEEGSFDAASSVFLFHELPRDVRRRVASEALRVLRPGARLVICDAAQARDAAGWQSPLENFPKIYHEPYFKSYLRDDLEAMLQEVGFQVESSEVHFLVKIVTARRPG